MRDENVDPVIWYSAVTMLWVGIVGTVFFAGLIVLRWLA